MFVPRRILEEKLLKMLAEDIGQGDTTTALIVPPENTVEARIIAKEDGVAAGIEETQVLVECLGIKVAAPVKDGERIKHGQTLMRISGNAQTILTVERTLLNILSRMCGIATATRHLVEKLQKAKLKTKVACTRKTAPGLLYFDKKAVEVRGGDTHRLHLDDMILIKDNHIAIAGGVEKAIRKARANASFSKKIEIEVTETNHVLTAAKDRADIIMFDNFTPKQIAKAIKLLKESGFFGKILLEASGGITAQNILGFASTGVDIVSLGEITASVKTLDVSLELTKAKD